MAGTKRLGRGFSIVELVTVGAVGGLLLTFLVPVLSRVKDESRLRVCVSNLGVIGRAANTYLTEFGDLPWTVNHRSIPQQPPVASVSLISEFIWGGGFPDKGLADWLIVFPQSGGYAMSVDINVVEPKWRPLNRFLDPHVSWNRLRADRTAYPQDIPDVFKCPTDASPTSPIIDGVGSRLQAPWSTWEFWGTSYATNWYWPYYYQQAPPGYLPPYHGDWVRIIGYQFYAGSSGPPGLGRHMLKDLVGRWGSRFLIFYENRLNYVLEGGRLRGGSELPPKRVRGWHGRMDYHVAAFRDGSARYQYFDTRYINGPGWTVWPPHPWEGAWAPYDDENP